MSATALIAAYKENERLRAQIAEHPRVIAQLRREDDAALRDAVELVQRSHAEAMRWLATTNAEIERKHAAVVAKLNRAEELYEAAKAAVASAAFTGCPELDVLRRRVEDYQKAWPDSPLGHVIPGMDRQANGEPKGGES